MAVIACCSDASPPPCSSPHTGSASGGMSRLALVDAYFFLLCLLEGGLTDSDNVVTSYLQEEKKWKEATKRLIAAEESLLECAADAYNGGKVEKTTAAEQRARTVNVVIKGGEVEYVAAEMELRDGRLTRKRKYPSLVDSDEIAPVLNEMYSYNEVEQVLLSTFDTNEEEWVLERVRKALKRARKDKRGGDTDSRPFRGVQVTTCCAQTSLEEVVKMEEVWRRDEAERMAAIQRRPDALPSPSCPSLAEEGEKEEKQEGKVSKLRRKRSRKGGERKGGDETSEVGEVAGMSVGIKGTTEQGGEMGEEVDGEDGTQRLSQEREDEEEEKFAFYN
uniref:Uncharacterized protein n=1 Tax=Palpitomonas bilix TaxID=652834 RepID=A0A7S3G9R3_9EUKA